MREKWGKVMIENTGKSNAIEFYRIFFTLTICLHHSQFFIGELNWLKHAYICVEFFFILSGVLLYRSFSREKTHSTWSYFGKRFLRLWPEYVVAAILEIFARGVFLNDFNLSKVINELMMVQNTGLFRLGGYNYPCWYIPIMLFCGVIIYSMLTLWEDAFRKLVAPLIILCGYTYIWGLGTGLENWKYINFVSVPMIRGISAMSIGVLIAILVERKVQEHLSVWGGTLIEVVSILFVGIGIVTDISTDMLTIVAFTALLFTVLGKRSIISSVYLNRNIWVMLSKYSYSIYLNHAIMIYVLSFVNGHIFEISHSIKPFLTFGCIVIYAILSKEFIDKLLGKIEKRLVVKNG